METKVNQKLIDKMIEETKDCGDCSISFITGNNKNIIVECFEHSKINCDPNYKEFYTYSNMMLSILFTTSKKDKIYDFFAYELVGRRGRHYGEEIRKEAMKMFSLENIDYIILQR